MFRCRFLDQWSRITDHRGTSTVSIQRSRSRSRCCINAFRASADLQMLLLQLNLHVEDFLNNIKSFPSAYILVFIIRVFLQSHRVHLSSIIHDLISVFCCFLDTRHFQLVEVEPSVDVLVSCSCVCVRPFCFLEIS